MDQIEVLDLAITQVTDEGVRHLRTMRTLRRLNFEGSGPTEAGIAELKQALPDTKIAGPWCSVAHDGMGQAMCGNVKRSLAMASCELPRTTLLISEATEQ